MGILAGWRWFAFDRRVAFAGPRNRLALGGTGVHGDERCLGAQSGSVWQPRQPRPVIDMHNACTQTPGMVKNVQIRNVPEKVHKRLVAAAAEAGLSLSEYLLAEVTRVAALPTRAEMLVRLRSRPRVKLAESAAKMVRRERDSA